MNHYFDHIYVINMKKDIYKKEKITKILNNLDIQFTLIEGIDPYQSRQYMKSHFMEINRLKFMNYNDFPWEKYISNYLDLEKEPSINSKKSAWLHWVNHGNGEGRTPFSNKLLINPGFWGSLRSKEFIIRDAIKNNYQKILILEDDICPHKDFHNEINKISELLISNEWDLLYLGASQHNWDDITVKDGIYKSKNTLGSFALAINSNTFKKLLRLYQNFDKSHDELVLDFQSNHDCYVIYPNIIISDPTNSNIDKNPLSLLDYSKKCRWDLNNYVI